jgi:3-deoxy-manno-octulosonate cytidylyltransferase (CMP-KDO synthetase)
MTPAECRNGTERCAAAVHEAALDANVIINFQGDAPLTGPAMVSALVERLANDAAIGMATPAVPCSDQALGHLRADRAAGRVGGTTVVMDRHGRALYFSKEVLPFGAGTDAPVHLHLGVYAYRPEALAAYVAQQPSPAELSEGLEQLRFLHMGVPVGVVVCPPPEGVMAELNNPTDVPIIEGELQRGDVNA